jgi:hypothetical protein
MKKEKKHSRVGLTRWLRLTFTRKADDRLKEDLPHRQDLEREAATDDMITEPLSR